MKQKTDLIRALNVLKRAAALLLIPVLLVSFYGCSGKIKPEDKRVVLTVGGRDICYDYFRYIFMNARDEYADGDLSCFIDDAVAQMTVSENTVSVIAENCAVEALADKYGIKLDDDDETTYKDYIEYYKKTSGSDEAYRADMKAHYLTDYSLQKMFNLLLLKNKLYDYMSAQENGILYPDDQTLISDIDENFSCIRYIMIDVSGSETEEYALSRAQAAYKRASAGEDFKSLIEEFSETTNQGDTDGYDYYYTENGLSIPDIEDAAADLEPNEISEIINVDGYGYFIIQRLELDHDYINANLDSLRDKYCKRVFDETLSKEAAGQEIGYTDLFNSINVLTME